MDAQDFRSLQEAYVEVIMGEGKVPWNDPKSPLESGHTPAEKNRAKRERTGVEDLSKSPTDKQYARYGDMKSADDEQSSASKRKDKPTHKFRDLPIRTDKGKKQTLGQLRRTRGTPKPGASDEKSNLYQSPIRKDDKRTRGGKTDQWKGPNPRNEQVDIYDIILSHLIDEGYADTQEAAEAIMVNMSEEWRKSIMIDEGLDMKTFKAHRKKAKASAARTDAVKRGHVGKEWYNCGRRYSPDEAKRSRANMDDEERRTRHRSAVDPDSENDDAFSADKTKNPKKLRKQKAMGELG